MSINTEMTALADAIRSKSGASGKLSISGMTTAVNGIVINPGGGGEIDFSGVNVTADKMLDGIVAIGATGNKVTGNIKTVTAVSDGEFVTVPAGFHPTEQTFPISSGDVGSNVEYGYVDADGKIQKIDLSGDTPVTSGEPVEMNIVAFVTGKDEPAYNPETPGGGGSGGGGTFDLAKVTQYSPATPAVQLVTSVDISGIEDLIWSDDPDSEDYEYNMYYSDANGTYNVTSETAGETDWRNRIYKHESKEYYLWYEYFDDSPEESTWFIGETIGEGFVRKYNDYDLETDETLPVGDLESGTSDWGDYDWEPFSVTLDVHTVEIPATDMVLKGVMATGYENSQWSFDEAENDFTGFETTPRISNIYALAGSSLIGAPVSNAAKNDFSAESALFALDSWRGLNELVSGTIPTGYKVDNPNDVLTDGVFCFNHNRALQYQIGDSLSALTDFTIEMDYTITSDYADYCGFFGNRTSWTTNCICLQWGRRGCKPSLHWNGVADGLTGGDEHREWVNDGKYHHVAVVRSGSTVYLFSDGKLLGTANGASNPLNLAAEELLTVGVQRVENDILPGRMKHFRVVPFAMYTADFSNNIPTWVGV